MLSHFILMGLWVTLLAMPFVSLAEQVFEVTGVVRGKLLDGRPVIEHAEIPGYMPAMTMAFNVADPDVAAGLQEGDKVRFLFHVDKQSSYAGDFQVTGKEVIQLAEVLSGGTPVLKAGDGVPAFQLISETGESFTESSLKGRVTLVTFIFTRCPVPEFCPLLATRFLEVQSLLKEEDTLTSPVRLLGVTLDPEFDRPGILQSYAKRVGADPAVWGFATGKKEDIQKLARAFDVISSGNGPAIDHTLTTALIDPEGKVAKLWPGNRWKAKDVLEVLKNMGACSQCCASGKDS